MKQWIKILIAGLMIICIILIVYIASYNIPDLVAENRQLRADNITLKNKLNDLSFKYTALKLYYENYENYENREPDVIEKEIYIDDDGKLEEFEVTGYSLDDPAQGTNSTVAIGLDIDPYDFPVIAVDPEVIPLYSIVEIKDVGYYIAMDTGGAIKGNRIDILFDCKDDALEFGRRIIPVKVAEGVE